MRQIEVEKKHNLSDVKRFVYSKTGLKINYENVGYWRAEVYQYAGRRGYIQIENYVPSLEEVRHNFENCSSYRLHGKEGDNYIIAD